MTKPDPQISVIVPVFNCEAMLADALASIFGQQGVEMEVIVIDDGSTDSSAAIAQNASGPVRYRYQSNSGPAAARNTGLSMARGEFIAFLDADDLWPPGKLKEALDRLNKPPGPDVVIAACRFLSRPRTRDAAGFEPVAEPRFYLQLGSAVFRRSVFDVVGQFNAELEFSEDIDWFVRARERGVQILPIPAIGLLHRLHGGNMTAGSQPGGMGIARVLKKSLDRRRTANGGAAEDLDFLFSTPLPDLEP